MTIKRSIFTIISICIVYATFVNVSEGIEINPTREQMDKAINYGRTNYKEIFQAEYIVPATFGNWPSFGSGLIKSKLVHVAVLSAMRTRGRKPITEEKVQEVMQGKDLIISYRGGADVYKIKLIQGTKTIESKEMIKPDLKEKDPDKHTLFIEVSFPYSELDPNAKTTVIIEMDFGTKKYDVDFSNIH